MWDGLVAMSCSAQAANERADRVGVSTKLVDRPSYGPPNIATRLKEDHDCGEDCCRTRSLRVGMKTPNTLHVARYRVCSGWKLSYIFELLLDFMRYTSEELLERHGRASVPGNQPFMKLRRLRGPETTHKVGKFASELGPG